MLKKRYVFLVALCLMSVCGFSQTRKATPKSGEGLHAFFARHQLSVNKHKQQFLELNKGKFGKNNALLKGLIYLLPDANALLKEPLFGKKYQTFKQVSQSLDGAVFYLVSGHGGPDPGAIGHYNGKTLHEDEYAYDVTLRLARKLMENGAKVYIVIQDKKDGIRDDAILAISKRETCMGQKIPLSQVKRLKQRSNAVNRLYKKDKKADYKRCIVFHVDSRSKGKRLDVFFYHHPNSSKGKRLSDQLADTFAEKYGEHQPSRGFTGTVSCRELYVVRKITPPVVFVELGNIQNKRDQQRFIKPNNRQALANWLYEGILKDFQK